MGRNLLWLSFTLLLIPAAAGAQERMPRDPEVLQQRIVERFMMNFKQQAGLTDAQFETFQESIRRSFQGRREYQKRVRTIIRSIEEQLRPGVAANADSVESLMNSLFEVRASMNEHSRQEFTGYAEYLNPIQRAILLIQWEQFQRRIEAIRARGRPGGPVGPGAPRIR